MAHTEILVHEVEVVMQTLAVIRNQICIFLSYRNDVIPPAKQIFGNVPKISIRSQHPNTPAICPV
jgi:hypothetical protein